jgi:RimJ/RimL family protein N-acetyltransferase
VTSDWAAPLILTGRHIRLEPLDPVRHAAPMFAHFDERVTQFLAHGGNPIASADDLRAHLAEINALPNRRNWAVIMLADGAVAGRASFADISVVNRWVEIGTMLMAPFWGGMANPESKLLLMTRAFDALGCNRVHFKVDARNDRSIGSMLKLGAVNEGTLRQYQIRADGYVRDSVMFSVLKDEWPGVRAKLAERVSASG